MSSDNQNTHGYLPDYPIPPGGLIGEYLEVRGYSQAEFASRCGLSYTLINGILAGKAPIEEETALRFEKVLGLSASVWANMESIYRLQLAKEAVMKTFDRLNAPPRC